MNWSPQQDAALLLASQWLAGGRSAGQVFRLFGFAGTGKTTLAQHLAGDAGRVLYGAYTGKAAYVMRTRGCTGAKTIHQLIYKPSSKSSALLRELEDKLTALVAELGAAESPVDQNPRVIQLRSQIRAQIDHIKQPAFVLNEDSEVHDCRLLVIDECSMVDEQMGRDLLSFQKPILVLGDPAQLPPVRGEGFFTNVEPEVMLSEIHRQAADSPVIRLATEVRQGRSLRVGEYGSSRVGVLADFNRKLAQEADQVIVGRNETRRKFNANFRERILGIKTPLPCPGDKVVCLRNNHDLGILNGQLWTVETAQVPDQDSIELTLQEETNRVTLSAHTKTFLGEEVPWWAVKDAENFDYGYALTCHKSQGSQWRNVLIFDESNCFGAKARQWLYTAITRAAERVTVLQK